MTEKTKPRSAKLFFVTTLSAVPAGFCIAFFATMMSAFGYVAIGEPTPPEVLTVRKPLEPEILGLILIFVLPVFLVGGIIWVTNLPDTLYDGLKEHPGSPSRVAKRYGRLFRLTTVLVVAISLFALIESAQTLQLTLIILGAVMFTMMSNSWFCGELKDSAQQLEG